LESFEKPSGRIFKRNGPVEARVAGAINLSHAAGAEP